MNPEFPHLEGLSVLRAETGDVAEREVDLHVVRAADSSGEACAGVAPVTHIYDGSMNDGFCDCGLPERDPVHEAMPAWEVAWKRSMQMQRELREDLWRARKTNYESHEWAADK